MYNAKVKVPWLIRTKHFPESKNTCQNPNVFWILGIILLLFLFWTLRNVSDSGTCFGFWEVFCPYERSAYAMRTSVINSQIFLILRLICHDQRIYEQIIFCKTGLSIKDNCIFLHIQQELVQNLHKATINPSNKKLLNLWDFPFLYN